MRPVAEASELRAPGLLLTSPLKTDPCAAGLTRHQTAGKPPMQKGLPHANGRVQTKIPCQWLKIYIQVAWMVLVRWALSSFPDVYIPTKQAPWNL